MRNHEYRALSGEGNWVYGDLVQYRFPKGVFEGKVFIEYRADGIHHLMSVLSETVCEYTGVQDIQGEKIFEFDLIKDRYGMTFVVIMDESENRFMGVTIPDYLYNERQGEVRHIKLDSVIEHQLSVFDTKYESTAFIQAVKDKESGEEEEEQNRLNSAMCDDYDLWLRQKGYYQDNDEIKAEYEQWKAEQGYYHR